MGDGPVHGDNEKTVPQFGPFDLHAVRQKESPLKLPGGNAAMQIFTRTVFRLSAPHDKLIILSNHFQIVTRETRDGNSDPVGFIPVIGGRPFDIVGRIAFRGPLQPVETLFEGVESEQERSGKQRYPCHRSFMSLIVKQHPGGDPIEAASLPVGYDMGYPTIRSREPGVNPIAPVSVVMPAYGAEATIARAVSSVLSQQGVEFELIIVADDETDYQAVLGAAGIADRRIRYLDSGLIGGGSPPARNVGLDAARFDVVAILDADDGFRPGKLAAMVPLAQRYGLVSCALDVALPDGTALRRVGVGEDKILTPGDYKFTNFSMDSMLVHDRRRADPRYDPGLPCLTDLDFLLKIFATIPACYHVGTPLHTYVKLPVSVSNGPGVTERMVATKRLLRQRLRDGFYPLADAAGGAGIDRFLAISLAAEQSFAPREGANPPDLFEDHIEPMLPI